VRVSLAPIIGLFEGNRCRRCGGTFDREDTDKQYAHQAWHQEQDVLVASLGAAEDERYDQASYEASLWGRRTSVDGYWQRVPGLRAENEYGRRGTRKYRKRATGSERETSPSIDVEAPQTPPNAMVA
jgi:hypothetical protein